jgi:hypothetical protein
MRINIILLTLLINVPLAWSQVGINTTSPTAALDVVGNAKTNGELFLENPGDFETIRGSKLLIKSTTDEILEYDIVFSKYGPINYAQFVFTTLSMDGLQDYDTKISIDDYIVNIQGYYFLEAGTDNTNVIAHSTINDDNIEGYQIYAYKNITTGTWFIRAFINNARFRVNDPTYTYLNVIIYRNGFISKEISPITMDMGNMETGTAPLPAGF